MNTNSAIKKEVCRIESDVAARISTAQVIVSLSCAVRQLVDNSLDASAQTIEIRVKNNGFDSVEVIDDGTGIEADSFTSLCKPHSTSKLFGINDFGTLSTLGFRGEALNALCSLATVTVTTKDRSAALGSRLRFDHCGNVIEQSSAARSVGTTVLVENLFETLPVRRKEFEKNAKKEYVTSLLGMLKVKGDSSGFYKALVFRKRQQLICTPGKAHVREVIINLFGGRTDKNKMVDVIRCIPNEEVSSIYGVDPKDKSVYNDIEIDGFVSSCEHGYGRSCPDRQFVYVNQRPVDYPKICRLVNEVYQQYNRSQYPTLVLYIGVPPGEVDVNVTPDKRMVFFEREKELLALIRSSFLATFHPLLGSYTSIGDKATNGSDDITNSARKSAKESSLPSVDQSTYFSLVKSHSANTNSLRISAPPQPKRSRTEDHNFSKAVSVGSKTLDAFAFKPISRDLLHSSMSGPSISGACTNYNISKDEDSLSPLSCTDINGKSSKNSSASKLRGKELSPQRRSFNPPLMRNLSRGFENSIEKDSFVIERMEEAMDKEDPFSKLTEEEMSHSQKEAISTSEVVEGSTTFFRTQQEVQFPFKYAEQQKEKERARKIQIAFSMTALKDRIGKIRSMKAKEEQASQLMEFTASIAPDENTLAEEELCRILKKTDFANMKVIGQFNKGFIITRLRDHLFLIDQHASDEKYNFERFQKKARVETQKMLHPMPLDLGAVQESVLKDNLDILEANGFGFEFQEKRDGCSVALLVSSPVLHSWQFDKSDIEEILAVVSEFPGVMYRPAKLRRIFASRACRKSVMIGTTLTVNQMQTILHHLGTLEQPWNCPHGRPTLRHLVDLQTIK